MSPLSHATAFFLLAIVVPRGRDGAASFAHAFGVLDGRFPAIAAAKGRGPAALPGASQAVSAEVENDEAVEAAAAKEGDSSTMTLNFVGKASTVSKPAPHCDAGGDKSPREFFALPEAAPLLLRGSKRNKVEEIERIGAELWKQYAQSCTEVHALPPTPDDRVFEVTTSGVTFFPGLRVANVATIGVKLIDEDLPGYELVFVRSATHAEGNRLLVWCFDRATGKDKEDGNEDGDRGEPSDGAPTRMSSLTRIQTVPEVENDTIRFAYDASLSIRVKCPSFLIKLVPGASKEKSERMGGASLRRVLEKDCYGSLELFHREYVRWQESSIRL